MENREKRTNNEESGQVGRDGSTNRSKHRRNDWIPNSFEDYATLSIFVRYICWEGKATALPDPYDPSAL